MRDICVDNDLDPNHDVLDVSLHKILGNFLFVI